MDPGARKGFLTLGGCSLLQGEDVCSLFLMAYYLHYKGWTPLPAYGTLFTRPVACDVWLARRTGFLFTEFRIHTSVYFPKSLGVTDSNRI